MHIHDMRISFDNSGDPLLDDKALEIFPDSLSIESEEGKVFSARCNSRRAVTHKDVALELCICRDEEDHVALEIRLKAVKSRIRRVRLVWERPLHTHLKFVGDEWSTGDGTSQWRGMDPRRSFPWYVLVSGSEETAAFGVMTQPAAFASWNLNPSQIALSLDTRNGTRGVNLDGRTVTLATIVHCRYERTPMATAKRFCGILSQESIPANLPVYGMLSKPRAGRAFDQTALLKEADTLAALCNNLTNRPFQIIDCGWEEETEDATQWRHGSRNFPDMAALADELHLRGIRPGISMRLLRDTDQRLPGEWRHPVNPELLDPSLPEVVEHIRQNVRQAADWGFEMLRHVSSTTDALQDVFRDPEAPPTWAFHDQRLTNAEILTRLYRSIKEEMGGMVIYGEDVAGHLAAGLLHVFRATKDAPGYDWVRCRHNRINALAFRLCQNEKFYTIDAGPIDITPPLGWGDVKMLANLVSRSSTAMIVSLDEKSPLTAKATRELASCFLNASLGNTVLVPTDWLENTSPEAWMQDGSPIKCHWYE